MGDQLQSALDRVAAATAELRAATEAVLAALPVATAPAFLPHDLSVLVPRIVAATAAVYHLPAAEILGRCKTQPICTARQIAMALCAELSAASTYQVAACFGRKDHGTVTWARKSITARRETDPHLAAAYAAIRSRVATGP